MEPELFHEVQLPHYGNWPDKAVWDPIHPAHGPLPDLCQVWEYEKPPTVYYFRASAWVGQISVYTMVELILEDSDPHTLLPVEEVYAVRGYIAQTYHWKIDKRSISCFDVRIELPPPDHDEEERRHQLLELVLKESVTFAIKGKG